MKKPFVVSTHEWLYPDVFHYESQSDAADVHAPRGGYAAFQMFFPETNPGDPIAVKAENLPIAPECWRLDDVFVKYNAPTVLDEARAGINVYVEGDYTREAPFRVYDMLRPFAEGGNVVEKEVTALYFAFPVGYDAVPGTYEGSLVLTVGAEEFPIPVKLTVHKASLPVKRNLQMANWFYDGTISARYGVEKFSDDWYRLYKATMRLLSRCRSTHMLLELNYIHVTEENGKYSFDFSDMEKVIEATLEGGMQVLELGHICHKDYVENGPYFLFYKPDGRIINANTPEGYNFLAQFLPRWTAFLKEHNWYDISVQHVGDEPVEKQVTDFKMVCGVVRKFMPGIKLFDAVSSPNLWGAGDCWVLINSEYEEKREIYEHFRELGDEVWQYTCCGPKGRWLNRFLDDELLRPRLLHYGNYLFDLPGYLHWGFGAWQADQPDVREHTWSVINHGTALLPAGDTHVIYPGTAENGPWPGMRAEAMRMGVEDCELLWKVAKVDKARADALCKAVMNGFDKYTLDPAVFEANYVKLLAAADEAE